MQVWPAFEDDRNKDPPNQDSNVIAENMKIATGYYSPQNATYLDALKSSSEEDVRAAMLVALECE